MPRPRHSVQPVVALGYFVVFGFRKEARPFEMWFVVVFFFYFYLFRVVGRLLATNKTIPHFHFVFYWEWEEKSVMNNISEWKKKRCIWPSVRERRCEWAYCGVLWLLHLGGGTCDRLYGDLAWYDAWFGFWMELNDVKIYGFWVTTGLIIGWWALFCM